MSETADVPLASFLGIFGVPLLMWLLFWGISKIAHRFSAWQWAETQRKWEANRVRWQAHEERRKQRATLFGLVLLGTLIGRWLSVQVPDGDRPGSSSTIGDIKPEVPLLSPPLRHDSLETSEVRVISDYLVTTAHKRPHARSGSAIPAARRAGASALSVIEHA